MNDTMILLGLMQLCHFFVDCFNMSYVFLFNPIFDIYFVIWLLLQTIHWGVLKNECIVSYIEKKLLNPNYELGSKPRWIPHYKIYYNKFTITLKSILILGGLSYIIYRNKSKKIRFIGIMAVVLWLYFTYFYKKPQL